MKTAGTARSCWRLRRSRSRPSRPRSPAGFEAIKPLVDAAIARHELPGAVVLVGRGDAILYHDAFGDRALAPAAEPMTEDTIFDLASLTKVVATTTSVMQLVEQRQIRLNDPRGRSSSPEFERYGQGRHHDPPSADAHLGLRPDLDARGRVQRRRRSDPPRDRRSRRAAPPGERFIYSDINFFLLGDIVRRVSGERLDRVRARRTCSSRSA